MSIAPLRLGLAGLGTVGIGVVKIVQAHADLIAARARRPVQITAVSARDPKKNRDADLTGYAWETDPVALARRDDVDVFVEVMGGHDGAAKDATEAAIAAARERGVLAVEMEAAGLYAFAQARSRAVICLAHVTNQMGTVEGDFDKGEANGSADALWVVSKIAERLR